MSSSPAYMAAAETLAQTHHEDAETILARFRQGVRTSDFPGEDCLAPHEVEVWTADKNLPSDRMHHVEGCPQCRALLDAAQPDATRRRQILDAVRAAANTAAAKPVPSEAPRAAARVHS